MLGEKLKNFRKENKLTQEQIAKKLKVSRTNIAEIESGRIKGTTLFIKKLSEYSGKPISYWMDAIDNTNIDVSEKSDTVLLRELLNMLHYKDLDKEIKIKIGDKIYNIDSISENKNNTIYIKTKL